MENTDIQQHTIDQLGVAASSPVAASLTVEGPPGDSSPAVQSSPANIIGNALNSASPAITNTTVPSPAVVTTANIYRADAFVWRRRESLQPLKRATSYISVVSSKASDIILAPSKSMKIAFKVIAAFGFLTCFAGPYALYLTQRQTDLAEATFIQGNEDQNQTFMWEQWKIRNAFYQSCQGERMLQFNSSNEDCEEAIRLGPPKLPFSVRIGDNGNQTSKENCCEYLLKDSPTAPPPQFVTGMDLKMPVHIGLSNGSSVPLLIIMSILSSLVLIFFSRRKGVFEKLAIKEKRRLTSLSATELLSAPRVIEESKKALRASGTAPSSGTTLRRRGEAAKEKKGQSVWEAAISNNMNVVQHHIALIGVNQIHKRYGSPLTAACEGGNIKIAKLLLDQKAEINCVGGRYRVPLQAAAYSGNHDLVMLLLDRGARIDILGGWNQTVLKAAANRGSAATVESLLDAGADPNLGGGSLGFPLQGAALSGKLEVVNLLLGRGANVNDEGGEYGSALNAATSCGSIEVVVLLLRHNANLNPPPGLYGNCVQIALSHGFPDLARLLVESGANGNVVDDLNRTPLIEAAMNGDEVLTRALLKANVDVNTQDADRYTALYYVVAAGQESIARMLIEEYSADVRKLDKFRGPPLHRAAGSGYEAICKLLLEHGADVNVAYALGATALHQACGIQPHIVELLLSRRADPNFPTSMGETPLHSAINSNNMIAVDMLLVAGSNANTQDNDQATPLFRAINKS